MASLTLEKKATPPPPKPNEQLDFFLHLGPRAEGKQEIHWRATIRVTEAGLLSLSRIFMDYVNERLFFFATQNIMGKKYTRDEIARTVLNEVGNKTNELVEIQEQLKRLRLGALKENIDIVLLEDVPKLRAEAEKKRKNPTELTLIITALRASIKKHEEALKKELAPELF